MVPKADGLPGSSLVVAVVVVVVAVSQSVSRWRRDNWHALSCCKQFVAACEVQRWINLRARSDNATMEPFSIVGIPLYFWGHQ